LEQKIIFVSEKEVGDRWVENKRGTMDCLQQFNMNLQNMLPDFDLTKSRPKLSISAEQS
jgi:hypothetical protein